MPDIVALSDCAPDEYEALLDDAFGKDRHRRTAYLLRVDMAFIDHLSFGLSCDDRLIGSIQCWPVSLVNGYKATPLILVGPVAVSPSHQSQGFGHLLMNEMIACSKMTDPPMVMVGDPEYYGHFGFSAAATQQWELPGPWERRRLLLRNMQSTPLPATGQLGPRR